MPPIDSFAAHLTAKGYHPRSNKHSNELCEQILKDLLATCKPLAKHAAAGEIVYSLNFKIMAGSTDWNIDLVVGEPAGPAHPPPEGTMIRKERPSLIRIGVEAKSVMTEHRKASRNRQRELDAFHVHLHNYNAEAVAAGVVLVNIAPTFRSPLRNIEAECPNCKTHFTPTLETTHEHPEELVEFGIGLFRNLPVRSASGGVGLEALSVIVVNHSNAPGSKATIHTKAAAPQVGDPLHYDHFIQKICQTYTKRFT